MKSQRWSDFAVYVLWLCCFVVLSTHAETGDIIPAHIRAEVPQATLKGSGTYRWFGLSIYDATLWTGPLGWRDLQDQKVALDLRYARGLMGKKIADASVQEMEKLQQGSTSQRQRWGQQMTALFPDVKEGTHITGIYLPNESVRFYLDGQWLGEIRDADFARAFFAIWLDPKTSAPDLRKKLLGN